MKTYKNVLFFLYHHRHHLHVSVCAHTKSDVFYMQINFIHVYDDDNDEPKKNHSVTSLAVINRECRNCS